MSNNIVDVVKSNPFSLPSMKPAQNKREIAFASAAPSADGSIAYGSSKFFWYCGLGGILSCGPTHLAVVPLDLVKCRLQVDKAKYKNLFHGFKVTVAEEGSRGLARGWAPTLMGYSVQGMAKFGLYEYFKHFYADVIGEENAYLYRTTLYLASSASAEFFADIGLAPFEAVKVRIQTKPGFPGTFREGLPKIFKEEGLGSLYKGVVPLWGRQIPYTMMKFACFERTVEALYDYVVPKARHECSKPEQLVVTAIAGYIAGVFCAVVSHPADTVVSKLNNDKGASIGSIVKKLGWSGMWSGLTTRIVMIGTLTALQWFIYDTFKVMLDLPRPPPPAMPESLKAKLAAQNK